MMLLLLITAPKLHCFYFLHITLCFFYSCFYPHISVIHMHIYHGMRARGNSTTHYVCKIACVWERTVQQLPHRIQRREEPRETILNAAAVCLPTGKLFRTLDFVCTLHWSIPYTAHALKLVHTCVRHILNQLQVFRCCSAMLLKNASYRYLKTHVSRLLLKPSFHVWHLARSSSSTVSIYRLAIRLNNFIKPVRCKKCIVSQIWSGISMLQMIPSKCL
jgi:hypothetical protein